MAETSNPEKKERGPSYLDNIRGSSFKGHSLPLYQSRWNSCS